jgi:hypothetical protein
LPTPGSTDALKITISVNTVYIHWYCNITGDHLSSSVYGNTRKVIVSAIQGRWSGGYTIAGITGRVVVTVEDLSDGGSHIYASGQKWSKLYFSYTESKVPHTDWPHGWSRHDPGAMYLYAREVAGTKDYSLGWFQIVAAHEFGHILGIKDGYADPATKNINSIMCKEALGFATNKDIQKALTAYKTNKVQRWSASDR